MSPKALKTQSIERPMPPDLSNRAERHIQNSIREFIGEKPERTRNARRVALYGCKNNWRFMSQVGEEFVMPCRRCDACKGNRINDLVGRGLAHALTCWDVWNITLTYADECIRDDDFDGRLFRIPQHIKAFVHAIRMEGERKLGRRIELQYFAAYEKGELNDRGHWHVLLFWKTHVPSECISLGDHGAAAAVAPKPDWLPAFTWEFEPNREKYKGRIDDPKTLCLRGGRAMRQNWKYWPHGKITAESLMQVGSANNMFGGLSYAMKYATKGAGRYLMSHGMGAEFYKAWIDRHVNAGLQVHDLTYTFASNSKMPMYNERMKEKRSIESGGSYIAKPRMRVYQIQGVWRQRALEYGKRKYRAREKERLRARMRRTGERVKDLRAEIRQAMSLSKMGTEFDVYAWERKRFASLDKTSAELLELEARVRDMDPEEAANVVADAGAKVRGYRTLRRVDGYSSEFAKPTVKGPAMRARERALMPVTKKPLAAE